MPSTNTLTKTELFFVHQAEWFVRVSLYDPLQKLRTPASSYARQQDHGVEHALVRGIAALADIGKEAKWIDPPKCDRCQTTEGRIVPCPITEGKQVAYKATGRDALLCDKCMEEI